MKPLISLLLALIFLSFAYAVAPPRTAGWCNSVGLSCPNGRPYAESICNTDPNIIACEDFNYPDSFVCNGTGPQYNQLWLNPAAQDQFDAYGCLGRQIRPLSSTYATTGTPYLNATKTGGSMPSGSMPDSVWAANWDSSQGTADNGSSWLILRKLPTDAYANGAAAVKEWYVRFQLYFTPNYVFPGDPKTAPYGFSNGNCGDNKIVFNYNTSINFAAYGQSANSPAGAEMDAGPSTGCGFWNSTQNVNFADGLQFRIGQAGTYETFPNCNGCSISPQHMEYTFESLTLRNPYDTPQIGKAFRFNTGVWYTLEYHYKMSASPNSLDGVVEAWINGVKIYSASDLATCGSGQNITHCEDGLAILYLSAYHNGIDPTVWNGQELIDNLVVSRSYIGPPQTSLANNLPPTRPVNLTLR